MSFIYNNTCVGCGTLICPMCLKEPDDCRCENKEGFRLPTFGAVLGFIVGFAIVRTIGGQ